MTAESLMRRGPIPAGQNMDTLLETGEYEIPGNTILNSLVNGPAQQDDLDAVQPGPVSVRTIGSGLTVQELRGYASGGVWSRTNRNTSYVGWTRWRQVSSGFVAGKLPADANADSYTGGAYRGAWSVTAEAARTVRGLPAPVPGLLDVISPASDMPVQVYSSYESTPRRWTRTRMSGQSWGAWQLDGGGGSPDANRLLVEAFTRRRGGRRGTGGTGAVAFRFDHNVEPFRAKVLPLLAARGIPATLAVVADMLDPGYPRDPKTTVTWPEIQGWAHNHGIEPAWHSKTHEVADDVRALESEIVGGHEKLSSNLPQCAIETALMVGVKGTYYCGFGPINTPEKFYGTEAGRLFLRTVAVTGGHLGGHFWPLTGQPQQGLAHVTVESYESAADIIAVIEEAQDTTSGVCMMIHPSVIDKPGYITSAMLEEVLDYVAAERDAGQLAVLTHSGLVSADASTDYVHSLTVDGKFKRGLDKWTGSGWTTSEGDGVTWAQSPADTDTGLRQDLQFTRRYALTGSPRELVVKARSECGGVLRLSVRDRSSYSAMDATRDCIIPGGNVEVEVRVPMVIPYSPTGYPSMTLRTELARIAGGSIGVTDIRLQTV